MSKRAAKRTKGQGSVFLDPPSPYWQLSYWNGWRQVRESARTTDYAEAVKTLQRKLGEIAVGKSAGAERIRVAALLELLVEDYRRNDRADLQEAEQRVNRLLKPNFGHLRASAFTTKAVNRYIELRQSLGRQNATINRELALLRRAFRLGHEHDPQLVFRLPVIKALPEDNVREGFLEADRYRLILDALTDEIKPVFVVAYHLGMRTGELLKIKRSWVDLDEGLIYVNGRVTKNKNPKVAPIYGDMRPWLEMLLSRGAVESPKCIWLFSRNGKPVKDFKADWAQACEKADVPGLLFHDLRRTAVRNMIRAGVPEKVAMQISGHKTASMLWRYNITDARDIKDAGKRTERYLEAQRGEQHAGLPTEYFRTDVA
ncbi:MAG TPA: site-specific integrase [Bryobacteraceae bacterium]|jgi:Site-specific recombinase XerD|nr:site-specific integrase [Bryobacteraceae bacterium]